MKAHEINLDEVYTTFQHSRHRRPSDAGSADRYYGRRFSPNFAYEGHTFEREDMTPEHIAEYTDGWDNEHDRKDWGSEVATLCLHLLEESN